MISISKNNPIKVLLVGMGNKIFIPDLLMHLQAHGIHTESIDLLLGIHTTNNKELIPFGVAITTKNPVKKNFQLLANILRAKKRLKKNHNSFDVCNIHFLDVKYFFLKCWIKRLSPKLMISTYGSDFYKYRKYHFLQRPLYSRAKIISFTNVKTKEDFDVFYKKKYTNKLRICGFGLSNLPALSKIISQQNYRLAAKKHFGFPEEKLVLTLGYHSNPVHQHEAMLSAVFNLAPEDQKKLFIVLPMAYGGFDSHESQIRIKLEASGLSFYILKEFLSSQDIVLFRAASDIMINIPLSDQFSATMQEYLFARNIVITGGWLPYKVLDQMGIVYSRIENITQLQKVLENVVHHFEVYHQRTSVNPEIISSLSDWDKNINDWIESYHS